MKEAQSLAEQNKYSEALEKSQKAQTLSPDDKYIYNFSLECQKYINARKFKEDTKLEKLSPKLADDRKEIDMNLREAKLMVRKNELEAAVPKLERVLLKDPFNMEAVQILSYIYRKLYRPHISF